jgi:general secretion pathway protein D
MAFLFDKSRPRFLFFFLLVFCLSAAGCASGPRPVKKEMDYAATGDWDKSVQHYQKAYNENPNDPEIKLMLMKSKWNASLDHMVKGEALLKQNLYEEAIAEFQMSIAYFPSNDKAGKLIEQAKAMRESNYYSRRGQNYLKGEKYSQAREAFERALNLNPENAEARAAMKTIKKEDLQAPKFQMKLSSDAPISLKFKGTPVINVFEALTKITGVNFVFDKDTIDSKVTLFMTDVPFDRFLEVLLKTNNMAAKMVDEKTMIIYPNTPAKAREYDDLQIKTFYLANMDVKKGVALLAKILKSKDIIANEALNAVVIRGPRQLIEVATKVVEANDRPSAEVVLNVEILEVSRRKEKQLGIEINPPSVTFGIGASAPELSKDTSPVGWASLSALGALTSKELLLSLPTAKLNLLKQDADTTTLANPQIRVKDGEKATIHIGERVPLRVNRRIDTTGAVTSDYIYQDIGVQLQAEPSINIHGEVTLRLFLEVSALGPNLGTADEPQFAILARRATSVLMVRDGEPVIMGGLISDEERTTLRKIPLLGEIPVVGRIFSNEDKNDVKTDILMAITPIISRAQEIPGADVSTIWSGSDGDFSLRTPYESYARRDSEEEEPSSSLAQLDEAPEEMDGEPEEMDEEGTVVLGGVDEINPFTTGQTEEIVQVVPAGEEGSRSPAESVQESVVVAQSEEKWNPSEKAPGDVEAIWPSSEPYSVHVNSYPRQQMAEERILQLERLNFDAFMVAADVPDKGRWYRVFVGRFKDRPSAESFWKSLKERSDFRSDIHVVNRQWGLGG